ncbi:hypothetical protein [Methylibium petroleiphilum]|uniref:hypothetical protein n=1 Tax=Methylibium petroleiphilum TaxID=105560 RepID=UPI001AC845D1|nr:hypothetical protein [Methylibium petroleiphilum]MBN9204835.1 hypothetical protein [Methylibium petroleiphilum]
MKPDAAPIPPEALTPIERLERSRARLRKTWVGKRRAPRRDPQRPSSETRPNDAGAAAPDDGDDSTLDVLVSMLTRWWERHPLRQVSDIAAEVAAPAARSILGSLAERHPLRLVALAAGAGALLVAVRPWRWLPQAALSSMLLSALWPRGGPSRWLSAGGLASLLASGDLSRLLASLAGQAADGPISDRDGPEAPEQATAAAPPAAAAAAADAATATATAAANDPDPAPRGDAADPPPPAAAAAR